MSDEAVALTQRDLLMELRKEVQALTKSVSALTQEQARLADSIKTEQDLGIERRANMRRTADALSARVDEHAVRIDNLERRNDKQDGAAIFAKAAFGTSAVALLAVVLQALAVLAPTFHLP